ncbi:hypothetical protein Agub_g6581, partial [Astrephomene gubernaculifera]
VDNPWVTVFRENGLSSSIICHRLAERLELTCTLGYGNRLPEGPVGPSPGSVEVRRDPDRGGLGLFATVHLRRSAVICSLASYVMPADTASKSFMEIGLAKLRPEVRQDLGRHCGDGGGNVDAAVAWGFLTRSFRVSLTGPTGLVRNAATFAPDLPSLDLHMLGYGNEGALVNDPRVNPWTETVQQHQQQLQEPQQQPSARAYAAANCLLLPVFVRGLLLPVLVTNRDIAPGEQLTRDYGADWWRHILPDWELLADFGVSLTAVLYGKNHKAVLESYPPYLPPPPPPPSATTSLRG